MGQFGGAAAGWERPAAVLYVIVVALIGLVMSARIIKQYERVVLFELGKVKGQARGPAPSRQRARPVATRRLFANMTVSGSLQQARRGVGIGREAGVSDAGPDAEGVPADLERVGNRGVETLGDAVHDRNLAPRSQQRIQLSANSVDP